MTKEQRAEKWVTKNIVDADTTYMDRKNLEKSYLAGFTQAVELCAEIAESEAMPKMSRQRSPVAEYIRDQIKALASEKGE